MWPALGVFETPAIERNCRNTEGGRPCLPPAPYQCKDSDRLKGAEEASRKEKKYKTTISKKIKRMTKEGGKEKEKKNEKGNGDARNEESETDGRKRQTKGKLGKGKNSEKMISELRRRKECIEEEEQRNKEEERGKQ